MHALSVAVVALALLLSGCDGQVTTAGEAPPIARIHRAKCSGCHLRVEPGTHTGPELSRALARHRSRVPLREEEWKSLLDYLAGEPPRAKVSPGHAL